MQLLFRIRLVVIYIFPIFAANSGKMKLKIPALLVIIFLVQNISAQSFDLLKLKTSGGGYGDSQKCYNVVVDDDKNIYMHGRYADYVDLDFTSQYYFTGTNYSGPTYLAKYDSLYNLKWVKILEFGYFSTDKLIIDNYGCLILTGRYSNKTDFNPEPEKQFFLPIGTGSYGGCIAKYSPFGKLMWATGTYGTGYTAIKNIDIGADNSIYIAGEFKGTIELDPVPGACQLTAYGNWQQAFVAKYDQFGNFEYGFKPFEADTECKLYDIAVTGDTAIVVSGFFRDTTDFDPGIGITQHISKGSSDCVIAKYSEQGTLIWAQVFGGTAHDESYAIDVDKNDQVYFSAGFNDTITINTANGSNTYFSNQYDDIIVGKLKSNGIIDWTIEYGGPIYETATDLILDDTNNIYISGNFCDSCDFDPGTTVYYINSEGTNGYVASYDSTGSFRWVAGQGETGTSYTRNLALNEDNIYCVGDFKGHIDMDPDTATYLISETFYGSAFIASLNSPTGSLNEAYNHLHHRGGEDKLKKIICDPNGNSYSVGTFERSIIFENNSIYHANSTKPSIFIVKKNSSGDVLWVKTIEPGYHLDVNSIAFDRNWNILLGGIFSETVDFNPDSVAVDTISTPYVYETHGFLLKLDTNGNFVWVKHFEVHRLYYMDIATDSQDNIYLSGQFSGLFDLDPGSDTVNVYQYPHGIFLIKLDSAANFEWGYKFGANYSSRANTVAIDSNDNVYIGGEFSRPIDFDPSLNTDTLFGNHDYTHDGFIVGFDPSGNYLDAYSLNGPNTVRIVDIEFDVNNNLYVVGNFKGSADLDPGPDTMLFNSPGTNGVYVLKLGSNKDYKWARLFASSNNSYLGDLAHQVGTKDDKVHVGGRFNYLIDFKPNSTGGQLVSNGEFDGYFVEFDTSGVYQTSFSIGSSEEDMILCFAYQDTNIIVGGYFEGQVDFDPSQNVYASACSDVPDAFWMKIGHLSTCNLTYDTISISECDYYIDAHGNIYFTSGTYVDTIQSTSCDTVRVLQLNLNHSVFDTIQISSCQPFFDTISSSVISQTGYYPVTFSASNGCDSIVILDVSMHNPYINITDTACDIYISPDANEIWNQSGIYHDTIFSPTGCDSIYKIDLTINNSYFTQLSEVACYFYYSPDSLEIWSTSGLYYDTLIGPNGCDSVIETNLTLVDTTITKSGGQFNAAYAPATASFQWIDCATYNPIAGAASQSFTPTQNGTYAVIITYGPCYLISGCHTINNVGVNDFMDTDDIEVYPNPTKEYIIVKTTNNTKIDSYKLYSSTNQLIQSKKLTGDKEFKIQLDCPAGLYYLHLQTEEGFTTIIKCVVM